MLRVDSIRVEYNGLRALQDVTLEVRPGEFVVVIGRNGAGKTTMLKAISGTVPLTGGRVAFKGVDLGHVPAHQRTGLGIVHVPEGRHIFPTLTVQENLDLGAYAKGKEKNKQRNLQEVFELFPVLQERRNQLGGTLSGGEQQMLALGRGLMGQPELVMLDEPSMGLAPLLADAIFDRIRQLRDARRVSILLVEQRAVEALDLCDRGYVLETGRVVLWGSREELLGNREVQRAYLGTARASEAAGPG